MPLEIPFTGLRLFACSFLHLLFGLEVRGLEHLEALEKGAILAGNHAGLLDSLMVLAACRRKFRFLMTEEVFGWGWIGKVVRFGNIIPLYKGRERQAMKNLINRLRAGETLCIFPEGRLTEDGDFNPFNPGVAFLQEKSGRPIIPFALAGGFEAWGQDRPPRYFSRVAIEIGEPIPFKEGRSREETIRLLESRVRILKEAQEAHLQKNRLAVR